MDVQAILDCLAYAEGLPEDAILAARAQRAAVAPALIELIERHLAGEDGADGAESALFYAFHLLGEWHETAAYRPLARLLARPAEETDELLGDATTETVHRVMAAVFDGDPQPLFSVIEAQHADPFVRSRMLETLAMLVLDGRLARGEVARYLRDAFGNLRPHEDNFVWYGWQSAVVGLGLGELSSLVGKAFARGLIDPSTMTFEEFKESLRHARTHPESPWKLASADEFTPFADTLAEFGAWQVSAPEEPAAVLDEEWDFGLGEAGPASNPFRNVGRNDPCPCGSGKKFKKCCLT